MSRIERSSDQFLARSDCQSSRVKPVIERQVITMGAGTPPRPGSDEVWAACITAKTAAEADLRARDLD
jgi:hypothetical protein